MHYAKSINTSFYQFEIMEIVCSLLWSKNYYNQIIYQNNIDYIYNEIMYRNYNSTTFIFSFFLIKLVF